jgi:hypothetical protein
METITISLTTVLFYILSPLVIYCILYYGIMTDKRERYGDTDAEIVFSLMMTIMLSIALFFVTYHVHRYHFIFTL